MVTTAAAVPTAPALFTLAEPLDQLKSGDTQVIYKPDRVARSMIAFERISSSAATPSPAPTPRPPERLRSVTITGDLPCAVGGDVLTLSSGRRVWLAIVSLPLKASTRPSAPSDEGCGVSLARQVSLPGEATEQTLEVLFGVTGLGAMGQPRTHQLRCGGAEYEPCPRVVLPCQAFGMIAGDDGVLGRRDDVVRQRGDVGCEAVDELVGHLFEASKLNFLWSVDTSKRVDSQFVEFGIRVLGDANTDPPRRAG